MKRLLTIGIALLAVGTVLSACGPTAKEWKPSRKVRSYGFAHRQLAPEPVYSRTRWVHLPEPLPGRESPQSEAPTLVPVFHFEVKDATCQETAVSLAAAARYNGLCAGELAERKITFNALGTIDELAQGISRQEKIRVVVDHQGRLVRFMAAGVEPSLYGDAGAARY